MTKTLALIAAAATLVVANTTLAPVAEAGGVRLQFGYPLGSFVARECGSCGSGHRSYGHHRAHRDYGYERRAAARAEARREAIAEARRAKIAAAKAEARREAIAEARREKVAAAKAEARREALAEARREALAEARRKARLAKEREEKVAKAEVEDKAPAAAPLPERAEVKKEADVAVGEPKVILDAPRAGSDKAVEKVEKVAVAPPAPVRSELKKAEAPAKPTDCKKFVPSAGLTITVPCQ